MSNRNTWRLRDLHPCDEGWHTSGDPDIIFGCDGCGWGKWNHAIWNHGTKWCATVTGRRHDSSLPGNYRLVQCANPRPCKEHGTS